MSEGLRKATEKYAALESRAKAAYDKLTEAKAAYAILDVQASTAREYLDMWRESDGAVTAAPVAPKAVPAPAPTKASRPKRAPASEESDRQRQPNVRVDALAEFKRARDGITPSQMVATLRVRRPVTPAQVQTAFDYLAKRGQIEPYPDGGYAAWRHIDHAGLTPRSAPEPTTGNAHYAADDDAGEPAGNGADADPMSNAEFDELKELLKVAGDEGLSKDEIRTHGFQAEEIDDAENAGVIRLRLEDEHYLLCSAEA